MMMMMVVMLMVVMLMVVMMMVIMIIMMMMIMMTKADLPSRYVSRVAIDRASICSLDPTNDISQMWEEELNLNIKCCHKVS